MDDRRRWIIAAVAAGLVLLVVLFAADIFSGDEAEATEPEFSWRVWVVVDSTTTSTSTTTTTEAPSTTSTSTTTTTAAPTTTSSTSTTTTTRPPTTTSTSTTTTTRPPTTTSTSTTTTAAPSTTTTVAPTTTTVAPTTTVPPTTTTTPPSGLPEAPADVQALVATFVDDFNRATDAGDVTWLFDHLAPAVTQVYGEAACRSHVDGVIVDVAGLTLDGPVLGPVDRVVEVPRPGGDPVVVDLRGIYEAAISYRYEGALRSGTGWLQLVADPAAPGGTTAAYFARCTDSPVSTGG